MTEVKRRRLAVMLMVPSIGVVSIALLVMSAPADLHRRRNALAYGDKAGLVARVGFDENARPYGDCRSIGHLEARDRRGRRHGDPKALAAAVVADRECQ